MKSYPFLTASSVFLGCLTIVGLFFSWPALLDIKRGLVTDFTLEWKIVYFSRLITVAFVLSASLTILVLKTKNRNVSSNQR